MDKLIFVGGSKGGTGKSTVCGATLDYLIQQKKKPLLIESDGTNPDVWKAYKDSCDNIVLNLDEAEGWIELINVADKTKGRPVVVNTAARNSAGVERYGETLRSTLKELDIRTAEKIARSGVKYFIVYHPALTYYARDYGLRQVAIEADGKEPSAKQLTAVIRQAREDGVRRIFYQNQFPASTVEIIARDIDAEYVEIDPLDEDAIGAIDAMTDSITAK